MFHSVYRVLLALTISTALHANEVVNRSTDELNQDALQKAFRILQNDYWAQGAITYDQLNQAALSGVLTQLSGRFDLIPLKKSTESVEEEPVSSWYNEWLVAGVLYLRPQGEIVAEYLLNTDKWKLWQQQGLKSIILDLRSIESWDYTWVQPLLSLFIPVQTLCYEIFGPEGLSETVYSAAEPMYAAGNLLVLLDQRSAGAVEILAGRLQQLERASLIGISGAQRPWIYAHTAISEQWQLRYATHEVRLPQRESLLSLPLSVDIWSQGDADLTQAPWIQFLENGKLKAILNVPLRQHFNETALLQGRVPELEAKLAKPEPTADNVASAFKDSTLRLAVDILVAKAFLQPQISK